MAKRLFRAAIDRLDVTVVAGDETFGRGGPVAVLHRPEEFYARIGRHQLIGFGEAYLTGAWDTEHPEGLGAFLSVLAAEMPSLVPERLQTLRGLVVRRPPRRERSSRKNSRDNIAHHYDLSNDLFELFLDPSLSYSSALFPTEHLDGAGSQDDLLPAQLAKIDRLLDQGAERAIELAAPTLLAAKRALGLGR